MSCDGIRPEGAPDLTHLLKNARIILPGRIIRGCVEVEGEAISNVYEGEAAHKAYDLVTDLNGSYLSSGFIEIHTHGAGGSDFMDGTSQAYQAACLAHLAHGTTTIFPTLLADSWAEIRRSLAAFREAKGELEKLGMTLPGVHLEGPYLNPEQKGAICGQYIHDPEPREYGPLLAEYGDEIARWTVAPELPGALELGDRLRERGVVVSAGHSNAVYSQVKKAAAHGYTHVTHLYSAMSTVTRRGGFRFSGLLEGAFCLPELTVELIADGCHLPPELLRFAYETKGVQRTALTCDSMRCAGQDVRESYLGRVGEGQRVIIEDDVAKLPDRSAFAGSIATDDRLVRVMYRQAGVPLYDAVRMMTLTPAEIMGLAERKGSIEAGKDADLVCFDEDIRVTGVMARGMVKRGLK